MQQPASPTPPDAPRNESPANEAQPVHLPIDGTLDLHAFAPADCREVLREYIHAAQEAGIRQIRIVHGKGIGTLREIVHAELRRNRAVHSWSLADASGGGWGATLARLLPAHAEHTPASIRPRGQTMK